MNGADPAEFPVTSNQQQLWFIDEFHHGLPAHNLAYQISVNGQLDLAAFRRALDGLTTRHAVLRTRFPARSDGRPAAVIDPPGPLKCELVDFAGLNPSVTADKLARLAHTESVRPFLLATQWPVRISLIHLSRRQHVILLVVHQLAFDDASIGVLLRDLTTLYEAEAAGRASAELPKLAVTFADYARTEPERLTSPALTRFWTDTLAGFGVSRFPTDRPRPLLASHNGAAEPVTISPDTLDGLRQLADQADVTLPTVLLSAVKALLFRYTAQTDLVVGTAVANRDRPELAALIGFVENTLAIRSDVTDNPPFTELIARVAAALDGARAHQDLPFARIVDALHVERDTGRFPVFQTWLRCREPDERLTAGGVTFQAEPVPVPASRYDLGLDATPGPDGLHITATYPPALFDAQTVHRLLGHLEVLLRGVLVTPAARLSQLPVLTDTELHREMIEWNDTAREFPQICIHTGFERRAARTPAAIAAEYGSQQISYADLNRRADQIARLLRSRGVGPEVLVGVCMKTGLTRLAALLGVWKAGGGYVPLDSGLPAGRLGYMIADTEMAVILTDNLSVESLPQVSAPVLSLVDAELDQQDPGPEADELIENPAVGVAGAKASTATASPSNVAYVIYTSGSTGQPKGVVVEHRHAINFLHGMIEAWKITPSSAVLSFAAYTFDVSVMDMFMPLLAGAKVVLAPPETLHSPPRLAALIRSSKVTFACLPPAVLSLLTSEEFPDLHTLLSAGEELTSELLRAWMRNGGGTLEFYNGYGPTEAAIGSLFMKLEPDTQLPPPIGRPKPNYQAYILDEHLNPVPVGVTGELHVGGAGVSRGYLNHPELTKDRFVGDPFRPGDRLYKTGDLARRRPDGTVVFAGRIDDQVKINGLRVELGEIETALLSHPDVGQAVVVVTTDQGGARQLTGYLRAEPGTTPQVADLRTHLARSLPGYMIPTYLITLDKLPLTTNGKIDKAALPAPETVAVRAEPVPPRTLIETMLVDLYATVLGNAQIGAADSFFDAGGNSLQALQLIAQLYSTLAVDLDVSAVFLAPTPQQLAAVLRDKHGFDDASLDEESIEDVEKSAGLPANL
ncbi:MAG TPA: amino acid adenylation domain-containing protein [Streptosporangiaceae bacterium]